jgi:hypothetical protein
MKAFVISLGLMLAAVPGVALANSRPVVPPGNSGANQYVEVIPTAGGGRPTHTVHTGTGAHRGPGSPSGGGGGAAVAKSTQQALLAQGHTGAQVAAIAKATAPAGLTGLPSGRSGGGMDRQTGPTQAPAASRSDSGTASSGGSTAPATALLRAVTGSGGGLGSLLPTILIAMLVCALVVGLQRRRRGSA